MPNTRPYIVQSKDGKRLVEATSYAQVLRHVIKSEYTIHAASARDVNEAHKAGIECESVVPAVDDDNQPEGG